MGFRLSSRRRRRRLLLSKSWGMDRRFGLLNMTSVWRLVSGLNNPLFNCVMEVIFNDRDSRPVAPSNTPSDIDLNPPFNPNFRKSG